MSEEHRYVEGSDNIYADLGLPDPEMELNRDILARRIGAEIRARGLSEQEAATLLDLDQPALSAILDGRLDGVLIDDLMIWLTRLGQDVFIVIQPKATERPTVRIEVEAEAVEEELALAGQSAVRPPST